MARFTVTEADAISAKLAKAASLLLEAESLVRAKDVKGEGETFVHIDSNYNDLTDTMSILWNDTE